MLKKPTPPILISGLPVVSAQEVQTRIALLLWGESSCGKTTYAATAPGVKLWLNLDPEGKNSIIHRSDVLVLELDGLHIDELFNKLQNDNPLELDQFLSAHPEVETVVLDSATALSFRALQKTVRDQVGASRGFSPTIEAPGISAYGGRNNVVLTCLTGLLKVTARHNCHCIITTHEDDPRLNKDGEVETYNMVLGGKTVSGFTWRLSEVWYLSVGTDHKRRLAVWPTRKRKPMKSRMFNINGDSREFVLDYDAQQPDEGQPWTIADIYNRWEKGGGKKLEVPTNARSARTLK